MLRCLTKSKIDCSFQNNEFRFKNRGSTHFFFFFLVFFFFFHFFGLHWMKLRNGMLKIMGAFLKRRGKKEEKTQFLWKKEKKFKRKKRPGRDSNPRSSVSDNRGFESPALTRPTPYHLATEPQRVFIGGIRIIECNNHNALCTSMFVTAQQHYYSSTWKYWTYSFIWIVHLWN